MADLLIKGMEMPKSCGDCPFLYDHDACYVSGMWSDMRFMLCCFNGHTDEYRLGEFPFKEKRVDWCPLVEVPTHGRLIDSSELLATITEGAYTIGLQFDEVVFGMRLDDIVRIVLNAPTVLEEEP